MEANDDNENFYFATTYRSFKKYKPFMCGRISKTENYVARLPAQHQFLLLNYKDHLRRVKKCIQENQAIIDKMLEGVPFMFDDMDSDFIKDVDKVVATREDIRKVETILKQLFREWSDAGQAERDSSFKPIIEEILSHFPPTMCDPKQVKILVPGAGLGRLSFEIARFGYLCQGNEFSLHMLYISNFLLNKCKGTNMCTIYPWIHQFSNNMLSADQLQPVSFPDINPGVLEGKTDSFTMIAGEFTEIYQTEKEWDCVATCYFIDCNQNLIQAIETIHKILKPGGIWINFGPLMYHFTIIEDMNAVCLPYHEVKRIISSFGFCFEKEQTHLKSAYCQNPNSMLKSAYECVYFVCRKPQEPLKKIKGDDDDDDDQSKPETN